MKSALLFILFIIAVLLNACGTKGKNQVVIASAATMIDTASGSCPYLTKDNKNNVVVSWIKQKDTTTFIFCYAVSHDEGKTFGKIISIPGSTNVHLHGENMPKIIFKPSGEIIAAWGAANPNPNNPYSGLVYYSQSFDDGNTWTKPSNLTEDTASFDQRYFDMALLPNGEVGIVWLDNRKQWNTEGSGLYYAVTKGNHGFQSEKLISGPCCQCCRTDLFIDRNKNIHVLYRAIINDRIRDMVHIVSTDNGNSFTQPQRISQDNWVISGCPHTGPAMAENKEGLHFTWFTGGGSSGIYYNHSKDNGTTFSGRDSVSGRAAKHCQITALPNDNILIVWNESFQHNNTVSSRIGIEERDANGTTITKNYITPETSNSSFPVICPVDATTVVVAYTENVGQKDQILFKQVTLE
ncbi:exo-alpha-sialidase [Ilyomonas limi]|uniref:Exo-alpha-sialidase n=1 Tax=Ilyomonas limi TaxID=2575867 RepID=A0A4U3L458_9BACT|nr:sialidase family protein [Ilyomonas limi]TKK69750.1 exo-alpha-sialidase [Ilyomonas limi]